MKIHNVLQGTPGWLALRAGIPTASELDKIVDHSFNLRTGETLKSYMHLKLAEKLLGRPMQAFSGFGEMEQGTIREDEAIPWLAFEKDWDIQRSGFITTDDGRFGCSPDGYVAVPPIYTIADRVYMVATPASWYGIEVKCPQPPAHVGYLLKGVLPPQYAAQVHGSMFATDASRWWFLSYCKGFPALLLCVERDGEIQKKIGAALDSFNTSFDAAYAKLKGTTV